MVNIYFTFRFGEHILYFHADLVNIYYPLRFGKILFHRGVVNIYTLAWKLVDIYIILFVGLGNIHFSLGFNKQTLVLFYFGMSVNITGTLYLPKLTININLIYHRT